MKQQTIKREIRIEGIGLHSGKTTSLYIKPALPNTGIVFLRTDLEHPVTIAATYANVTQTKMATTLGRGKVEISTVEHLLCALKLCGVDNAMIEVNGSEVPIMDGSSAPFCEAIVTAGIYEQAVSRKVAVLKKRIEVRKGDKIAMIEPANRLHIRAKVEWDHPVIGAQDYSFTVDHTDMREISGARTFGFLKDVEELKKAGLAQGGSLDNAVVLNDHEILNPNGLRYANEFVRHKVLDAIGDLSLAPFSVMGDVMLHKAGHEMHAELISAIFSDQNNYEVRSAEEVSFVSETVLPSPSLVRYNS